MRTLVGFAVASLVVTGLFAQNRSGFVRTPGVVRTVPSVVFPAGTSGVGGVQRTTGSIVYPAGGNPQIGIPSAIRNVNPIGGVHSGRSGGFRGGNGRNNSTVYAYPVFVGGYGYGGYDGSYDNSYAGYGQQGPDPQQQQQPPNITVIYPPQSAPVMMNPYGPGPADGGQYVGPMMRPQAPPPAMTSQTIEPEEPESPSHFLIAFKDHTIYSAIAYWVDGDTLHYFTTGNTHNQVSVSLIDRDLTLRLNKESGIDMKLPVVK